MTSCSLCPDFESDDENLVAQHLIDHHKVDPDDVESYITNKFHTLTNPKTQTPYQKQLPFNPSRNPLSLNLTPLQRSNLTINRTSIRPDEKRVSKFEIPKHWKKNDDHYYSLKVEIPLDDITLTFTGTIIPGNASLSLTQTTVFIEKGLIWDTTHTENFKKILLNKFIPFHVKNPDPKIMDWEINFMKETINKINEVKGKCQ